MMGSKTKASLGLIVVALASLARTAPRALRRAAVRVDSVSTVAVASQPVMTSSAEVMRAMLTVVDLAKDVKRGRAVKKGLTV